MKAILVLITDYVRRFMCNVFFQLKKYYKNYVCIYLV